MQQERPLKADWALSETMAVEEAAAAEVDFAEAFAANQRRIYRVLLGVLRDHDAAETLTQDCFLRAYQTRGSFRGECSVSTWLVRIAINLATDRVRSRRAEFWRRLVGLDAKRDDASVGNAGQDQGSILETFPDRGASPEREVMAREQEAQVFAALEGLSAQQRTAFVLRFVEEMSVEEVAQMMSVQPGTVKSHLFRAVGAVRKKLKEQAKK